MGRLSAKASAAGAQGERPSETASPRESDLAQAWRERRYREGPDGLRTMDGRRLHVVSPGRPNSDRGPDFLAALLRLEGTGLVQGDVEVHLRASDWEGHGHQADPHYFGVVLHVVLAAEGRRETLLPEGAPIPLLELPPETWTPGEDAAKGVHPHGTPYLERTLLRENRRLLEAAGEERFATKAAALAAEIGVVGPEQALYEALMAALGYSKNTDPFRELAQRLPFSLLQGIAGGVQGSEREVRLAGLLFGTARLLPSLRGVTAKGVHPLGTPSPGTGIPRGTPLGRTVPLDEYGRQVEEAWRVWGELEPLPAGSWRLFRVRPDNHPVRRIAAADALLARSLDRGLVETTLRAVGGRRDEKEAIAPLLEALRVGPEGYWADHGDFGRPRPRATALLGRSRALEVMVNVTLPFLAAYADWSGNPSLKTTALAIYRSSPSLAENGLVLWAASQLLPSRAGSLATGALRQQGLLHLAKTRF
ncbi:MAG: DUF2851 family protein [Chloroflexi bacterium]|nr:DUF2851 family protein [Chloroflexota bacterium]